MKRPASPWIKAESGQVPNRRDGGEGKKNRLLPMAPEFAEMLESVPVDERTNFVFSPKTQRGGRVIRRVDTVSSIIVEMGEKAGVKVSEKS